MTSRSESPGLSEARRLAKDECKGPVPLDYRPPVRLLPGKPVELLDGQLDLDGHVFVVDSSGVADRATRNGKRERP